MWLLLDPALIYLLWGSNGNNNHLADLGNSLTYVECNFGVLLSSTRMCWSIGLFLGGVDSQDTGFGSIWVIHNLDVHKEHFTLVWQLP